MKRLAILLAMAMALTVCAAMPAMAANFPASAVFDDFDRADADKDLSGGVNSADRTVWWMNWDAGTSIEDKALKMTGETHFGAGVDTGTDWQYLVLRVKGDATGVLVAPGGKAVALADLKGADGLTLPALTDEWQDWLIDIEASGLTRDPGLHLNIAGGTLYVDSIVYASSAAPEATAVPVEAVQYPETALVDDFSRPADEADNSGGQNSEGRDTWWYNAYDYVIEDGALVVTFDGDKHQHFGVGANVPAEANYPYLILRVKGVAGGDYSGLLLNLGAKNPVLFSDMKDPLGSPLSKIGTSWTTLIIDLAKSGVVFDQGFHINSDTVGTLYIDEIYYSSVIPVTTLPAPIDQAVTAASGGVKENPDTGDNGVTAFTACALALAAGTMIMLRRKARR